MKITDFLTPEMIEPSLKGQTKVEVLAGKHWLKITPAKQLTIGEYALVEILSASDINQSVWDFRVDPQLGDNPASLGPIYK